MKNTDATAADSRKVRVFDAGGDELQPTYKKRAKGLVKHGRAQWCGTDPDAIVLVSTESVSQTACPAGYQTNTEDTMMSEEYRNNEMIEEEIEEIEAVEEAETAETPDYKLLVMNRLTDCLHTILELLREPAGNNAVFIKDVYRITSDSLDRLALDMKPAEPSLWDDILRMKLIIVENMIQAARESLRNEGLAFAEYQAFMEKYMSLLDALLEDAQK